MTRTDEALNIPLIRDGLVRSVNPRKSTSLNA
jgi:hypothetical protein